MSTAEGPRSRPKRPLAMAWAVGFAATCGLPYLLWWAHPSLFDDDFLRVGGLRRSTLGESLFRPFNEHMAPLFETVTWLAWVGAGRRVSSTPLAFQVSSYLAFGATVALLAAWVGRGGPVKDRLAGGRRSVQPLGGLGGNGPLVLGE